MRWIVKFFLRRKTMNKTIQRHMWSCHVHRGLTKVSAGSCPFWSFGRSREQHVPASSNHSLYLIEIVQLQRSWGKQAEWNVTNDLHASIVPRLHENVPLSGTVHHLSGPDMFALTRSAVCVCVCVVCSLWVCGVCWCIVGVLLVCLVVCGCGVSHTLSRSRYIYIHIDVHVGVTLFARFLMKKRQSRTLTFHDVCFSKPFHLPQRFHVICFSLLFQALLEVLLEVLKMLETATRGKKHETMVEGQRLRKADIMESKCSKKTSKKSDADLYMHIYMYM